MRCVGGNGLPLACRILAMGALTVTHRSRIGPLEP